MKPKKKLKSILNNGIQIHPLFVLLWLFQNIQKILLYHVLSFFFAAGGKRKPPRCQNLRS